MRISAQDLANVLKRLPNSQVYRHPIVNIAVQGKISNFSPAHLDIRVVTFRKRETPTHISFWEVDLV